MIFIFYHNKRNELEGGEILLKQDKKKRKKSPL